MWMKVLIIVGIIYIIFGFIVTGLMNAAIRYQNKKVHLFSSIMSFLLWPIFFGTAFRGYKAVLLDQVSNRVLTAIITKYYSDKFDDIGKKMSGTTNGMADMFTHFANSMHNGPIPPNMMNNDIPPEMMNTENVQETVENPEVVIPNEVAEENNVTPEPSQEELKDKFLDIFKNMNQEQQDMILKYANNPDQFNNVGDNNENRIINESNNQV